MINKLKLVIVFLLYCFGIHAQQDSQYTQYMYNTITVNPGYTGTRGTLSALALYRAQWIGLRGAPATAAFSIHSPFKDDKNSLGLSVLSDEIGPARQLYVDANYAYVLQMDDKIKLSLGLKAGGSFLDVDFTKLNIEHPEDPQFEEKLSRFSPIIGAGAYLYSDRWYAGVSMPSILETKHYSDIQEAVASEKKHFYVMGGYVFDIADNIKFKPATIVKVVSGAPLAADLSVNFLFNEKFTIGAAYRFDAAVSALAGFVIADGLNIGYAYDYDTNNIGKYNSGSHEIFIQYDFIKPVKKKIIAPRFF